MITFFNRLIVCCRVSAYIFNFTKIKFLDYKGFCSCLKAIGYDILFINIITSFSVSLVLSLQIVKEFLYLNAVHLVSSILALSFIRELSPILTSVIIIAKVGSLFTSEIGTMATTGQIDSLFILGINPVAYLIYPRFLALIIVSPLVNIFFLVTSFLSSSFVCFLLYDIDPNFFFNLFYASILIDSLKSLLKVVIFAFGISIITCVWGITTAGGSQAVGLSTTSSVVTSLLFVFILNFILSYVLFDNFLSVFSNV